MKGPRTSTVAVALALMSSLTLAGCGDGSNTPVGVSVAHLRLLGQDAGQSPASCPIHFDVPYALGLNASMIGAGEVRVDVSAVTTPPTDPVTAQQQGRSALDVAAAVFFRCQYDVSGTPLDVEVVATPEPQAALGVLGLAIEKQGHVTVPQLQQLVADAPDPGAATLTPNGQVALARVVVHATGDVALVVTGGGVEDSELHNAAQILAAQVAAS